jgi:GT2 family glycosyltransferase
MSVRPQPDVSVVIVNWNSKDILRQCLVSIGRNGGALDLEVIVIDSGSFDGCGAMLAAEFPDVRFLQSDKNLGFARANNEAARFASGEFLLFLNPDTEIVGAAIQDLHRLLQKPGAGIAGARLLNADRTLQTSCVQSFPTILNQVLNSEALRRLTPKSSLWGMRALFASDLSEREVEAISGACLMLRRTVFAAVHGFSEEYFMYAEDMDLAYRVRRAGYRNYYVPSATVIHYGGSSSGQAVSTFAAVMLPEAIWRFLRKNRGPLYGMAYRGAIGVSALARVCALKLAMALPGPDRARLRVSGAKWTAVLRWSVRRDDIVRRYYAPRERPLSAA